MQSAINTDVFVMNVMDTLTSQMEMWAEQERLKQIEAALYMNLMNATILMNEQEEQLPAEWVDDTPRVIETFLKCMQLEKRTEATITNYRGELKCLFQFLRKNYADVTTNDIKSYLYHKQYDDGNSEVTLNNKIHVFQSFYKWVMNEDLAEDGGFLRCKPKKDPMAKVHKIKAEKKVKTVLSDEQVEIIRCDCTNTRDRAIVELLIATGMRISELVGLDLDDLDIHSGKCIIYGKGRKERPAFFTPRAIVHLKEYLEERLRVPDSGEALFVNFRKTGGAYTRLSDDSIRHMLKELAKSDDRLAGLNLHPHMFRTYLATYMARHGASLKDIQRILGHSNLNTTMECYLVEIIEETQAAHSLYAA